jgi:hypothetical protein
MIDKRTQQEADQSNMEKDLDQWVTGDEPMTGAQRAYLKTLSEEAHEPFDENLTKAEASKRIEGLQQKTGRGIDKDQGSPSMITVCGDTITDAANDQAQRDYFVFPLYIPSLSIFRKDYDAVFHPNTPAKP